jgi:hypothetical protein
MIIHRTVTASVVTALTLIAPFAVAQTKATKADDSSAQKADKTGTKTGEQTGNSSTPSRNRDTDSDRRVKTQTTTVAGQKATNEDEDLDMRVGKTETTAADPNRRDVIESRAEARREGEGRRVTIAPLAGYGFNGLGAGAGVRAGYTFDTPVYVGGSFMYHTGENNIVNQPGVTDSNSSYLYPGVEVGYDIGIGPVLVRPYVGTGLLVGRMSTVVNNNSNTNTESALMFYPGATAHYIIGKSPVFVGGDTRVLLPLENQGPSLTLLGTAGLHL